MLALGHTWYGMRMNAITHFLSSPSAAYLIIALVIWSLIWKGVALWFAARNYQKGWYIAILILNTLGILEIIYLAFFRRDKQPETKSLFEKPVAGPDTNETVA